MSENFALSQNLSSLSSKKTHIFFEKPPKTSLTIIPKRNLEYACMENIYEDFISRKGESVRNDKAINLEEAISCGSRVFFTLWENFSTPASTAALKGTCGSLIFHVNVLAVI